MRYWIGYGHLADEIVHMPEVAKKALVKGVGVAQVAELLGHTSTDVVSKTYGHLADQLAHMREAAKKAVE